MIERGHEVAIMSRPGGWLSERADELDVAYFENPDIDNSLNPLKLWRAGRSLTQAVDRFKPDLVSCHSTIAGLVGRFALRGNVPTIFTAHGWGFAPGIPQPRRSVVAILERLAARHAASIICVSNYDRELALNSGVGTPTKLQTVHNGVEEIASVVPLPRNDGKNQSVEAIFVGRLVNQKDPLLLIGAVAALPEATLEKFHLTIVGDGPLENPTRLLITQYKLESSISITPRLERRELFKKYSSSDLFILTSNWEGLPRSILEAMAHGLPVIATDVGGVSEAIGDDAGLLVPRGHQSALTQALKRLITDANLRKQMGDAGRAKTLGEFSLKSMCEQTHEVYKQLV
ncbi:MAG: glycosyltransferase family 4 protein [Parcubacteria group bacterium]|nr:glycosyltransferase family 4 protein [Parcubacteria group bacterium]